MRSFLRLAGLLCALSAAPLTPAAAQDAYPSRPITMIVPFAAGGTSDVLARVVAEQMGTILGQRIINENIAGAGGATALARAARAEADGYTIAIGNAGTNAATYTIHTDLTFKPESFVPVAMIAKTFGLIAIKKDFAAKTLKEFIAHAKANPGKVTLGHAGIGSSNYLICQTFVKAAGIEATLVGYRGAGPALNDLIGGQIDGVCDTATSLSSADSRQAGERHRLRLDRAAAVVARRADRRRGRPAGVRVAGLECPVRAEGHARRGHRQAERGGAKSARIGCRRQAFRRLVVGDPVRGRADPALHRQARAGRDREISQAAGEIGIAAREALLGPNV